MSNSLSTFTFNTADLRVIDRDGEPWFIAKDVCDVLGYTNVSAALAKHVDDDDRSPFDMSSITKREGTRGGNPRVSIINESGLYSLVMGSKLPAAKDFKKWVTSVVLPAIRKDGGYVMGEEKVVTGEMSEDEFYARAVVMAHKKVERLAEENQKLAQEVTALKPVAALVCDETAGLRWFMRRLPGVNLKRYMEDLVRLDYLYVEGGVYKARRKKNGLTEGWVSSGADFTASDIVRMNLVHCYIGGQFTMLKGKRPDPAQAYALVGVRGDL